MEKLSALLCLINIIVIFRNYKLGLYLFTCLIPISVLFPITPVPGLNGTAIVILLLYYMSYSNRQTPSMQSSLNPPSLNFPIKGLCVVTLISIITSKLFYSHQVNDWMYYFTAAWRWFIYIFLYFVYKKELKSREEINNILLCIVAGLFLEGLIIFKEVAVTGRARAYGTYFNPNELAQFFSSYFLITIICFFNVKKMTLKAFCIGALGLTMFSITSSLSRGGFMCFAMSLCIYTFFKSKKIFYATVIACVLFSGAVYSLLPDKIVARINETFVEEGEHRKYGSNVVGGVAVEGSALSRMPLIKGGLEMFKESPILGKGFNAFYLLIGKYKYGAQFGLELERRKASHNMHIKILSEMGLAGYFFFLLIFFNSYRLGVKLYSKSKEKYVKEIAIALICTVLAFLIGCLFGDRFNRGILITYYFALSAVCYNLYLLETEEANKMDI